jgi:putative methanogenesis marker protein 2
MAEAKEEIDLKSLAEELRNFEGITRKRAISNLVQRLGDSDKVGSRTITAFGEDAAVLSVNDDMYILLAVDGIWGKLLNADPWWAGYCAVLVNVMDIAAMGGVPLAMVNLTSTKRRDICLELGRGMQDGVQKFGVPMVGGHMHPDTIYDAIDVSIMGTVDRDSVIYSNGARPGDKIVAAIDLDGQIYPSYNLAWDTTTMKSPAVIKQQLETMVTIGKQQLATAGKDISNPGTIGTLGMLLESSRVGALVDLTKIPRADSNTIPFVHWLKVYPGTGFVLTVKDEQRGRECIRIFEAAGIAASIIGEVDASRHLKLTDGNDTVTLFDFTREIITGIVSEESD